MKSLGFFTEVYFTGKDKFSTQTIPSFNKIFKKFGDKLIHINAEINAKFSTMTNT